MQYLSSRNRKYVPDSSPPRHTSDLSALGYPRLANFRRTCRWTGRILDELEVSITPWRAKILSLTHAWPSNPLPLVRHQFLVRFSPLPLNSFEASRFAARDRENSALSLVDPCTLPPTRDDLMPCERPGLPGPSRSLSW